MLNKVILIGRLAQDPELRYTPSGAPVASFALAVERTFTTKQGERETDFINIVVWQKLAENCANHLGKGRLVAVDGRLQIRSYDDNQGIRRKAAEVVANDVRFLDWPKEGRETPVAAGGSKASGEGFASEISFNEEEIPF
ncbi:MAG TPA: single-stranded DNA-binding protein [Desulfotomaculum sp.]|nr:MAG: single-stranded DNA-binding protein [Peptococcaceae bacterium BRH_c8a]KJS70981.1 MAG: single-stranded DNA-binding protein [Desulfotomaculum sp. BICA1-6]HBX23888.1 single-stranded DNA-binding protein [Desulfotomaculum sp.]